MSKKYPTWVQRTHNMVVSEERQDGRPDFIIERDLATNRWHVKWRTSARWSDQTFASLAEAKATSGRRSRE
jgi:hypothetical protein